MASSTGSTGEVIGAIALWSLLGVIVLLLLGLALMLLRKARRARYQRNRATNLHDDPFRRAGQAAVPLAIESGKPVSTAVERFALLPVPQQPRLRRPSRNVLTLGVVVLLALAVGGVVWWRGDAAPGTAPAAVAPSACPSATLRVAAAPEIAPVIRTAAKTLAVGPSARPDGCGPVEVVAEEPAATRAAKQKPGVWIPSSSAWLSIAGSDGARYTADGDPLARSPIVIAAPEAIAGAFAKDGATRWAALIDGVVKHKIPTVTMADPLTSTVGMLSVYAVQTAMHGTTPDDGIAQLRALTLRSRLKDAAVDPAVLLERTSAQTDPATAVSEVGVFPSTEQQLSAYRKQQSSVPLTGAYPVDGLTEADYPFAVAESATPAERDVAKRLRAAISSSALTEAGFRTDPMPATLELPKSPDQLLGPALQWSQYRSQSFQVLLLIDSSGSMNERIIDKRGRSITKAELLRESGLNASQLFGEDTDIGMWFFSTPSPSSPASQVAVPLGPLTETIGAKSRRDVMTAAIAGYKPTGGAGTPLYQTVLDGQAAMAAKAKQGTVTLIVVLTDGKDEQSRFAMANDAFLGKLTAGNDPARPVPIIAVGYGAGADMPALAQMSRATGGTAISATNPADVASGIAKAFLAAHAPS